MVTGSRITSIQMLKKTFQVSLEFGRMPCSVTTMLLTMDWHLTVCGCEVYRHCSLLLSPMIRQFHGL